MCDNGCGCPSCTNGTNGTNGVDGDSAYDIWIGEGNVGTEQDFLDSLVGADGADGADGVDGVPNPKDNFYAEFVGDVDVSDGMPNPAVYHFPTGYGGLTYTNSSGSTKVYIVQASFDSTASSSGTNDFGNWVDGAIIKTVSAVDSIEWEHLGMVDIRGSLYNNSGVSVDINTTEKVLSDQSNPVEFRFGSTSVAKNNSFFKYLTLNDGESVSLKFKTKDVASDSRLNKAQLFVLEVD